MKKAFLFVSLIAVFSIIYFALINRTQPVTLAYSNSTDVITVNFAMTIILVLLIGLVIGSGIVSLFLQEEQHRAKAYKRELEKSSIQGSNHESRVEVLEAKIKTLEKAFDSVLDERTQLELEIKALNAELEILNKKKNK